MLPLSPTVGMGHLMLVLVTGVALERCLERCLAPRLRTQPAVARWWRRLGAPSLRSALIVSAVALAYPALFGLRAAPPLVALLANDRVSLGVSLGLVFLARPLALRLAAVRARPGLLDALQGLFAVAVMFRWFAAYLGAASVSLWPGFAAAAVLAALCLVMPSLAAGLGYDFGARVVQDRALDTLAPLCGNAMGMIAVAPIMMIYGYLLGLQIGI